MFSGAFPLRVQPAITLGGVTVANVTGYLVSPGLYQFNITVPNLSDGDYPIIASLGGASSNRSVLVTIQR
jgi:uncharacterized protein (TIGR03437 family)